MSHPVSLSARPPYPCAALLPWLIAQAKPTSSPVDLKAISEHWGGQTMIPVEWIMIALGVVLLVLSVISLRRWWKHRHLRSSPLLVFRRVAQTAGLSAADQWLLVRIARHEGLPTPLTLMLSPKTLRHHARGFADARPRKRTAVMQRVASIRRTLFGPAPGEADDPPAHAV